MRRRSTVDIWTREYYGRCPKSRIYIDRSIPGMFKKWSLTLVGRLDLFNFFYWVIREIAVFGFESGRVRIVTWIYEAYEVYSINIEIVKVLSVPVSMIIEAPGSLHSEGRMRILNR
ncbi:hypothetical protein TWF730_009971 [Orbilia blumenaviensis]|uniref:Uncharacterized protein n=1 Tax=Orbilia blumenaviensis TaxID=1796055 RepID=A0AAV9UVT7_9PEZI